MPHYLTQVGYTPESWAAQVKNPKDVRERVGPAAEALGGRIEMLFYVFGEYDLIGIVEFPNDAAAASWAIATAAGGALRSMRTTPLISIEDGLGILGEASRVAAAYRLRPEPDVGPVDRDEPFTAPQFRPRTRGRSSPTG